MNRTQSNISQLGNSELLNNSKLALFCSIKCPGSLILQTYELVKFLRNKGATVVSGFHSPMEQECLNILLKGSQPIILCPARSVEKMRIPELWQSALNSGRLLLLSPFKPNCKRMTTETARVRNTFVADIADAIFFAYASPGGQTEYLAKTLLNQGKKIFTFNEKENLALINLGIKGITRLSELENIL